MLRENSKWWTHKDESIDAMCRGGTIRSSDEASVMEWSEGIVLSSFDLRSTLATREEPMDKTRPLGAG